MTPIEFNQILLKEFEKCSDISSEIVKSIVELIDPVRTGRKSIDELEKTEKTYIGTKVEIILRYKLQLKRGEIQDCVINDKEFDIKCTIGNQWMIPKEAVDHFCLLVKIDWDRKKICVGTVLASMENLSVGQNQDQKRTLSKKGKESIIWIYEDQIFQAPEEVPHIEWKLAA